jgi:putative transcriptional regulator
MIVDTRKYINRHIIIMQKSMRRFISIVILFSYPLSCPGDVAIDEMSIRYANTGHQLPFISTAISNETDRLVPIVNQVELGKGIFLVASRKLHDPNFSQSVILLTDYSKSGTSGLIINRRTDLSISELFPNQEKLESLTDKVHLGGPVALNRIQILFQSETTPTGARVIFGNIFVVESIPLLNRIAHGEFEPSALNVYAGYAGWAAGQLESELLRGDWYLWQADSASIFSKPAGEIWPDLIRLVTAQWVLEQNRKSTLFMRTSLYNFHPKIESN